MSVIARRVPTLLLLASLALLCAPLFVHAVGMDADKTCNPVIMQCGCGQIMGPKGCIGGNNRYMCPCSDTTSGHVTAGVCVAPNKCQAKTGDGKGVDSGLSQLGQILGQLLGKLLQPSPPSPSTPLRTSPALPHRGGGSQLRRRICRSSMR